MAALKLLMLTIFISLISAHIGVDADASIPDVDGEVKVSGSDGPDPSILEQFTSKIHSLESHIEEKNREIKDKGEVISVKEQIIKEKSDSILSLENEVVSLQRKSKLDAAEKVGKIQHKAGELEKEVEKLRKSIDVKIKEKELLEAQATEAEEKASGLNSKFDGLQKTIENQKKKIRKFERALQIAEDELKKAKFEATSKIKELMEVHGAWLPPWLAFHFNNCQSHLQKNWKVHGKPAVEKLVQKAIEKKAQAKLLVSPHVKTIKTKWVPVIKNQWIVILTNIVEIYEVSKTAVTPHIIKAHELADPFYQELRKFSKPYIDQAATAAKPHVAKLHAAVKPYKKKAVRAYRKFLKSATAYHYQVQGVVREKLKSHELTKPLATKELVWFSASALLALPIIYLLKIFSAIFGLVIRFASFISMAITFYFYWEFYRSKTKKPRKPIRNSHANNSRRKGKRVHADK